MIFSVSELSGEASVTTSMVLHARIWGQQFTFIVDEQSLALAQSAEP